MPSTVALATNHQAFEGRVIEMERALRAQGLDRFHEDEVGRAGAIARRSGVRQDEEFSGFEMGGGLETDSGDPRSRIAPADGIF